MEESAGLDDDTPPDEDEEYWNSLEPLPEDPDDPESLTDPYKEEARYDAVLKMVSGSIGPYWRIAHLYW